MKNKKFASFLAAAAALVLLAMPAFAADEQTELPAAEAAEVQQEQTAAPAEQETALPADAQTAGEPEQQLTYVALGDSITSGVGLADMKYNIAQIGYDLQPNFEGYPSQCYTALVGKGLGLDRQHAINLGLPGLMSPDMLDMVQNSAMPKMNLHPDRLQRRAGALHRRPGRGHQLEERAAGRTDGQRCPA